MADSEPVADVDRGETSTTKDECEIAFDQLFGFLQSVGDVYARAHLKKQLDILYEAATQKEDSASSAKHGEDSSATDTA